MYRLNGTARVHDRNGQFVDGVGVVNDTKTLVAVANIRMGSIKEANWKPSANGQSQTFGFGEVEVFSFSPSGDPEGDQIEGEVGASILKSTPIFVSRSRVGPGQDPRPGNMVRTMVNYTYTATNRQGAPALPISNLLGDDILKTIDEAVNSAAEATSKKMRDAGGYVIVRNPSLARASAAFAEMADIAEKSTKQRSASRPSEEERPAAGVTAEDVFGTK